MSNFYKSDELIESVKQRAFIPENQSTFTTEKFLRFANEEMMIGLVPTIMVLHEEHFLYQTSIPLEANKSRYEVPYRAMGSKVYEVAFRDSGNSLFEMTRITKDRLSDYSASSNVSNSINAFYMENDEIVLAPNIGASAVGSLEVTYYMRPNKLVALSRAAQVLGIDRNTGIITFDQIPTNFSTSIQYDFLKLRSPHIVINYDISPLSINTTLKTVTFNTSDIPDRLVVNDYVLQAEETIIPTIPSDLHSILAQRIACRCLESLGDTQGLQNALLKLAEMEKALNIIIDNRVEGSPLKVVNRWSHLRNRGSFRRGRF